METKQIVAELDAQIARLKEARGLLTGDGSAPARRRGRPAATKPRKNNMSPEGRRRIAEAMKRRWAERKKQGKK